MMVIVAAISFRVVFFRKNINESNTIRIEGQLPSGHTKVVAFYPDGEHTNSTFSGGKFSINVEKSSPLVLIFLTDSNDYLGYVTLGKGIDTFPLTKTAEGVVTIDLQNLSLSNNTFTPSHNPLGSEIQLTPEEEALVAQIDDFFASQAKNPDRDNNGEADFLEGKFFNIWITYFIDGGMFGSKHSPAAYKTAYIEGYRLSFDAIDADRPYAVVFNGPEGSGLSNASSEQSIMLLENENETIYGSPLIPEEFPPAGEYIVTYKDENFSFEIPDQSSASSRIVLAVPNVILNEDGTLKKISWTYTLGGGSGTVDPKGIISEIMIQIDGTGVPYESYPHPNRMYQSEWIPATTTEHVLPTQKIKWSEVTRIYMSYNDVYRNHYVVQWLKNIGS